MRAYCASSATKRVTHRRHWLCRFDGPVLPPGRISIRLLLWLMGTRGVCASAGSPCERRGGKQEHLRGAQVPNAHKRAAASSDCALARSRAPPAPSRCMRTSNNAQRHLTQSSRSNGASPWAANHVPPGRRRTRSSYTAEPSSPESTAATNATCAGADAGNKGASAAGAASATEAGEPRPFLRRRSAPAGVCGNFTSNVAGQRHAVPTRARPQRALCARAAT